MCLYDKSHAKYKNRNATDQAWAAIASELGIEGNSIVQCSLSRGEKKNSQLKITKCMDKVNKIICLLLTEMHEIH